MCLSSPRKHSRLHLKLIYICATLLCCCPKLKFIHTYHCRPVFFNTQRASESSEGLAKTALSLTSRISDSLGLKWDPRICIPDKFPGDVGAATPWPTL